MEETEVENTDHAIQFDAALQRVIGYACKEGKDDE